MINLLPPARLANLRMARKNTILRRYIELTLFSMALLAMAILVAYYFLHSQQTSTQATVDVNQQKVAQLQPVQKQAEQLSTTINTISGLFNNNIQFSDMLTQIGNVTPPGSVLTGLQFSIEDLKLPLVISAQVDSEQKAAVLRNNLANSALFSRADIQTIAQIGAAGSTNSTPNNSQDSSANGSGNNSDALTGPYKYNTVINAYFKNSPGVKKP